LELAFIELLPDGPVAVVTHAPAVSRQPKVEAAPAKTVSTPPPAISEKPTAGEKRPAAVSSPSVAEQSPEEETPPASSTRPSGSLTLAAVKAQWRTMTEEVGEQQRNLPPLLTMGKPLALEGNTIVVGFDFPIFNKKFTDTAGSTQLIGETFSRLLGIDCTVRSVVTSEYTVPVPEEEFRALADELGGVVTEEQD
jgi:hypothetical protein